MKIHFKLKVLALLLSLLMILGMMPYVASASEHDPVPNYAYIPNALEASVSKVDLAAATPVEVARYSTIEPRPVTGLADYRVSRLAIDSGGNAWALNTMTGRNWDGYSTAQGSVARISATPVGADITSTIGGLAGIVGNDDRVSYHDLGEAGDGPRTITIVEEGGEVYLWIGFYLGNYFQKYWYNEASDELVVVEGTYIDVDPYTPYSAVLDGEGIMWVVSRNASPFPSPVGTPGVLLFDTKNLAAGYTTLQYDLPGKSGENPYAMVLGSDGSVWVSDGSNWGNNQTRYFAVYTYGSPSTVVYISSGTSQAMRGFMEDADGNIWATTINGFVLKGTYNVDQVTNFGWTFETVFSGWGELAGIGMDYEGYIWVIRHAGNDMRRFDPSNTGDGFITVGLGSGPYAYDNFIVPPPPTYEIAGYKFNDDTDDVIQGWGVELLKYDVDADDFLPFDPPKTTLTDIEGKYSFTGLPAGDYKVVEEQREEWTAVGYSYHFVTLPGGETLYPVDGIAGPVYNFRNAPLYEIEGYKYRTGTDIPLGGWTIELRKVDDEEFLQTRVTDINGYYMFTGLRAGDYEVTEVLKNGWMQTAPLDGIHRITLPSENAELTYNFYNKPAMKCYDDTIWAYAGDEAIWMTNNSVPGNSSNNWGWTNQITTEGEYEFVLYRGAGGNDIEKGTAVGTLLVNYTGTTATITYSIVEPYTLSEVHLWVGATPLPEKTVTRGKETVTTVSSAPGQLAELGYSPEISTNGLSATITIENLTSPFWVAAHGVVNWCEVVAVDEAIYYHWGIGYQYGATAETYAVAMVTTYSIEVWWLQGTQWKHDIYSPVSFTNSSPYAVNILNEPLRAIHGMHFPGLVTTNYTRTDIDVAAVPVPNAASTLIPPLPTP